MFLHLFTITTLLIVSCLAVGQTRDTDTLKTIKGDGSKLEVQREKSSSAEDDYEEWVRNMPIKDEIVEENVLKPIEPDFRKRVKPNDIARQQTTFKFNKPKSMMPEDNRLEYAKVSQRNTSGAMTIGVNILGVLNKLLSKRKRMSRKERTREKLRRIIESY